MKMTTEPAEFATSSQPTGIVLNVPEDVDVLSSTQPVDA